MITIEIKAKLVVRLTDRSLKILDCAAGVTAAGIGEIADFTLIDNGIDFETVKIAQYEVDGKVKFVLVLSAIGNRRAAWIVGRPTTDAARKGTAAAW